MLIFVLPSWYKTEEKPETCIFIYEQVSCLHRLGHEVVVISPQQSLCPFYDARVTERKDDSSTIYCKKYYTFWPSKFPTHNIRKFQVCATKLFKKAYQIHGKPDVIYAHFSSPAGWVATKIGEKYMVPVVIEEHYSGLMKPTLSPQRLQVLSYAIDHSFSFICVSQGLKETIEQKIGHRSNMRVISNMINPCFKYYPREDGKFVFLSIGSLIPRKGFDFLINTFCKVFKGKENEVELRIAGSGEDHFKLKTLIKKLGLEEQVFLLGQLSREETLQQYKECNCFVLTSQAETFGLVYREAMAVGRPIISTWHGGFSVSEWNNAYGFILDYADTPALEKALATMYKHYNEFDKEKISNLCLEKCDETVVMKEIVRELENAANSANKLL